MFPVQTCVDGVLTIFSESWCKLKPIAFVQQIKLDDDAFFFLTEGRYRSSPAATRRAWLRWPSPAPRNDPQRTQAIRLVDAAWSLSAWHPDGQRAHQATLRPPHVQRESGAGNQDHTPIQRSCRLPVYEVIVDNPWETDQDLVDTLMFLSRLPPPYHLAVYSLTFFPDTELYQKAKRRDNQRRPAGRVSQSHLPSSKNLHEQALLLLHVYARHGHSISPG